MPIRKTSTGFIADASINGKRIRHRCATRAEAKAWLEELQIGSVAPLSPAERADARLALSLLPPGVTLTMAAQAYKHTGTNSGATAPLVNLYLDECATRLRRATMAQYGRILRSFAFEHPTLDTCTTESIRARVAAVSPNVGRHYIRTLSSFFNWAIQTGSCSVNPTENVRVPKLETPRREVLTPEQTRHVLETAVKTEPAIVPYVAILAFAGLRPEEAKRLHISDVGAKYIRVASDTSKTHRARTVPITPNLRAWLNAYPIPAAGIRNGLSISRFARHWYALIAATGIDWTPDVLRHSYASYEYERTNDASATAANLGHTSTEMLFRHYRGLVPPGSGETYFSIRPGTRLAHKEITL